MAILLSHATEILTMKRGLGVVKNRSILLRNGIIEKIVTIRVKRDYRIIDARGCVICPGFVDSHTHLVFGGSREDEFALRLKGVKYETIARAGGGIANTVKHTAKASEDQLYKTGQQRIRRIVRHGTTTVEIKSGYGLRPETLAACYAMAETTFAATQTEPGKRARTLVAIRDELARGRYLPHVPGTNRNTKPCVSSGAPIEGCSLSVVDESGKELPDDRVGEIVIRSVSMFEGYRNQPEKTAEVLKGDSYFSGDYGFRHEGEYYVIGRKKDIIIVAGRNIAPEDVEDAVNEVPGVLPGRSVAFGLEDPEAGTEQICVVAETEEKNESGLRALRRAIAEAGIRIDAAISRVYLVPPRWLVKSSSGKLSRKLNKQRVLETFPQE